MFKIDQRSRTPIYEQIINNIKEAVLLDVLSPGEKLPSVREFAQIMTVNPNTVQKAFKELERQGVLTILRSKGTFIADDYVNEVDKEKMKKLENIFKKGIIEAKYLGLTEEKVIKIVKNIFQSLEGGGEN